MPQPPDNRRADVLTIGYGITAQKRGFILFLVRGDITANFQAHVSQDHTILDYTIILAGGGRQPHEDETAPENPQNWGPALLPAGYTLLSDPAPLHHLMGDDRWIGLVEDEEPAEGVGVLFYEEDTARLFLKGEEAVSSTAYLLRLIPGLLGACSPAYALAHPAEVESLRVVLWDAAQREQQAAHHVLTSEQAPPVLPLGYSLLTQPTCLDPVSGRWCALVNRDDYTTGGVLVYVDKRPLSFFSPAEIAKISAYLSGQDKPAEEADQ